MVLKKMSLSQEPSCTSSATKVVTFHSAGIALLSEIFTQSELIYSKLVRYYPSSHPLRFQGE